MKAYTVIISIVAAIALAWLGYNNWNPQAGQTLVEDANGNLVPAEPAQSTPSKPAPIADGSDEEWLTKFTLTERSGEQVGSAELMGQPYVAGFFFSTCGSICMQQNTKVKQLQDRFEGQPVRFLSISCDPEIDQPKVLQKYADKFEADKEQWLFMTGKMKYIRRVGTEFFRLGVERRGHPERFALVDAKGKIYSWYTWSEQEQFDALMQDIEKMIAAGGVLEDGAQENDESAPENQAIVHE